MKNAFWILIIIIISFHLGCKKQQNLVEEVAVVKDSLEQKAILVKFKTLNPDARKDLSDSPEFKPLKSALDSLNDISPETSATLTTKLYERAIDFQEYLPDNLKTNPIEARIKILVTETGMLEHKRNKTTLTTEMLNTSKKAIAEAYDNFVNQVNELYLAIPSNIAKELLQESKNLSDSIPTP